MNTRHPGIRALGMTVLAALWWTGTALAGWMWDTDADRIDDRMAAVETGGLGAAHVGGTLSGRLRFAVMNASAPFQYGAYIQYDHQPTAADAAALEALGVPAQVRYRYIPYIRTVVTLAQAQQVVALPGVTRVETIPMMYAVNDVLTRTLRARGSEPVLFPGVWGQVGVTGRGVVVAILDTGVNDDADPSTGYPGHESLRGKFVGGGNFYSGQPALNTPLDQSENPKHQADPEVTYHGTHVAGIAIGSGGPQGMLNGAAPGFYAGVAPDARLVDIKALSDAGTGFGAADGLEWCIAHRNDAWGLTGADTVYRGIDVANMSLGGTDNSDGTDASCAAVNAAHKAGIVVCVATGNDGNTGWMASPGAADFAVSVGAFTDQNTVARGDDIVADYSNEGPRLPDGDADRLDEMKPSVLGGGTGIMSALGDPTTAGDRYHHINGTSMACPSIAGVCALIRSANPTLTADQVRQILQDTAEHRSDHGKQPASAVDPFGVDPNYHPSWGWGQADAYAAVVEALNPGTTQVVRMAVDPVHGPDGVHVAWWTQREVGLVAFHVDRAPDALGGPGAWTEVHALPVGYLQGQIHAQPNRHPYDWTDLDPALDPAATWWYRLRWEDSNGIQHAEAPMRVRIAAAPAVARVSFSWTHNYSDGDLDVRFGTGTDPEHPIWFRQGEGAPAADSIVSGPGVSYTGTKRHYFHVDLTAEDMVAGFLPPGPGNPWFLRVKEGGYVNTKGTVNDFSITVYGPGGAQTFAAPNPPTATVEKTSTVFWIPLDPATSLNHAPVIAPVGARRVGEGLALTFTVSASDPDGQPLSYAATGLPPGATFNAATRTFAWTPGYAAAGDYTVTFVVSDGAFPAAAADTERVAVTVVERAPGDDQAPFLDALTDHAGIVGERMAFAVHGRDPEGAALSYSALGLPAGATLDPATGAFTWTPDIGQQLDHLVTFRVADPAGHVASQQVDLVVGPRVASGEPGGDCATQTFTFDGVVGPGTDPGDKSVTYHSFIVPAGTQSITGALTFALAPVVDLDFYLLDADSNAVQSAASTSEPEVLTYALPSAGTYIWKVVAFTNPDTAEYHIDGSMCVSTVLSAPASSGPSVRLALPAPNPFRERSMIAFDLPRDADALLRVYDLAGRVVRTLHDGPLAAGAHVRVWDGRTERGARARAGVYFYRLDTRTTDGRTTRLRKTVMLD